MAKVNDVYAFDILATEETTFAPADADLLLALVRLGHECSSGGPIGFAGLALAALAPSPAFSQVDRICLAARLEGSNELCVLSSHNSERVAKNTVLPGYRCFVDPAGSLFQLSAHGVRAHGEIDSVLLSFNSRHQPPQRTTVLMAEMGLKSGLCLPLYAAESIRGYLFLNSATVGLFGELERCSPALLSALQLAAKACLLAAHPALPKHPETAYAGQPFQIEAFQKMLQHEIRERVSTDARVLVKNEAEGPFLLIERAICDVLLEGLRVCCLGAGRLAFVVRVRVADGEVRFSFEHGLTAHEPEGYRRLLWLRERIADRAKLLGLEAGVDDFLAHVCCVFDPPKENASYSVST